jgi:hypothetical protein
VERIFLGLTYPRSQMLDTCSSISIEELFASEINRIYLDAVKLVFVRAKVSWKLSSIDAEKLEVYIDILDVIVETYECLSHERKETAYDIIGSFRCEFHVLIVVLALKWTRIILHRLNLVFMKERAD